MLIFSKGSLQGSCLVLLFNRDCSQKLLQLLNSGFIALILQLGWLGGLSVVMQGDLLFEANNFPVKAVHKFGLFEIHASEIVLEVDFHIQNVPAFLAKDFDLGFQMLDLLLKATVDPVKVLTMVPLLQQQVLLLLHLTAKNGYLLLKVPPLDVWFYLQLAFRLHMGADLQPLGFLGQVLFKKSSLRLSVATHQLPILPGETGYLIGQLTALGLHSEDHLLF